MKHSIEDGNSFCFYDSVKRLAIIKLQNTIDPQNFLTARDWLIQLNTSTPNTPLQGVIINISEIKKFDTGAFEQLFALQGLPVAFIASNAYQEHLLLNQIETPQESLITSNYAEAFAYIRSAGKATTQTSPHAAPHAITLDTDEASTYYDAEHHRIYITYYGTVTPSATADVYGTIAETIETYGTQHIHGGVFDFRHVTAFETANLNKVRSTSSSLNTAHDMSHIAVALVVGNMMQERMVLLAMKITPQEERKKILRSFEDAHDFIDAFHAKISASQS